MAGRPTKYNKERTDKLLQALRAGNTRTAAAHFAGIDLDTLANWQRRYSDFSASVMQAEADCEVSMVAIVKKAAPKDWKAAAWWLERRRKEDYRRSEDRNVNLDLAGKSNAELLAIVAAAAGSLGGASAPGSALAVDEDDEAGG